MKKLLMVFIFTLLLTGLALARNPILNGEYTTGETDGVTVTLWPRHTVSVYYTDADTSISALSVALEGSIDGPEVTDANASWGVLATHVFTAPEITAKAAMFHVYEAPVTRIRLNITTITGATSADAVYGLHQNGR
jgi:hypothetical protein